MKRFLVLLVLGLFVAAAGNAFAQPPAGANEAQVFYWDDAVGWVPQPLDMADRTARLFRSGDEASGNCNQPEWLIDVQIYAHIAQWIDFSLAWTQWDWFVRKPGCYAGNSIEAKIASNGDVYVDYEGFNNLMPVDPNNQDHNPIPVWYSFETGGGGVGEAETNGWVPANLLNGEDDLLLDIGPEWLLHYTISWKLWNKICVEVCNSACDYYDDATITLTLREQKPWIDAEGGWLGFPGGATP